MKSNGESIDHVLNIIEWKDLARDGEYFFIAQQRVTVVTREGKLGMGYTTVRVDPIEWVAPLEYRGGKILPLTTKDGMIVYERVKV